MTKVFTLMGRLSTSTSEPDLTLPIDVPPIASDSDILQLESQVPEVIEDQPETSSLSRRKRGSIKPKEEQEIKIFIDDFPQELSAIRAIPKSKVLNHFDVYSSGSHDTLMNIISYFMCSGRDQTFIMMWKNKLFLFLHGE